MLELRLQNIGIHKDFEISLPGKGLVLIKGKSGLGKSTILKSVVDAIYGECSSIKPRDQKNVLSQIDIKTNIFGGDAHLIRTRNPESVFLEHDGIPFKGSAAFGELENILSMNYDEFMASSYIVQGGEGSLLSLAPTKMREFVQNLVSKTADPEKYKKAILEHINNRKQELAKLQGEYKSLEEQHDRVRSSLDRVFVPLEAPTFDEAKYDAEKKRESCLNMEKDILINDISLLRRERKKPVYDNVITLKTLEKTLVEVRKDTTSKILELEKEIDAIEPPWPDMTRDEVLLKLEAIRKKGEYEKTRIQLFTLASKIHKLIPSAKDAENLTDFMKEHREKISESVEALKKQAAEAKESLKSYELSRDIQPCPYCDNGLRVMDGKIQKSENKEPNLEEKIKVLKEGIKLTEESCDKLVKIDMVIEETQMEAATLKGQLGEDPAPWCPANEVNSKGQELADYHNKNITSQKMLDELFQKVETQRNSVRNIVTNIKDLKEKIADSDHRPIDELEEEIKSKEKQLEVLYEEAKSNADLLEQYRAHRQTVFEYRSLVEKRDLVSKQLAELDSAADNVRARITSKNNEIAASERLKEKRDFAASAAIEGKTEEINQAAKPHIDSLFSEDGTYIRIDSFAKTAKGEERSRFGTDIYHKGCKVKKLNDLSGGEISRAVLAFQLGLSDIYDSPILMIDEGFKGLEVIDRAKCMNILSEVAQRKLVVVVEHNIEDHYFDKVIELKG